MKIDADSHNFGQLVTQENRGASEIYFQKPRPIFWEWFFFGKDTPLIKALKSQEIAQVLFNLEVEIINGFGGVSKKVDEVLESEILNSHAYNFGVLTAYCYVFGIRDLHKGNVVRTKTHLQVIDAEIVFSKILLPNETLLLPFKETTFDISGAKKSFVDESSIDLNTLISILDGFFDLFSHVINNHEETVRAFNEHRKTMLKTPIRHIMRDTIHYKYWREDSINPKIPLCKSELIQLERGDIPYYFKFINDSALYAYTTPEGDYSSVEVPTEFLKGVDRDATDPLNILELSRIANNLLPTGTLFILKSLLPKNFVGSLSGKNFKAEVTDANLKIEFQERSFFSSIK